MQSQGVPRENPPPEDNEENEDEEQFVAYRDPFDGSFCYIFHYDDVN